MSDELRKGPSGPPAEEINSTVINDAIVAGEVPATAENPGYVSRRVFVNAASTAIGQTYAGVTIEPAVTFTTAAELPPGNNILVEVFPAGGSGAGGRALVNGTDNVQGGTGGGGAAPNRARFSRADIITRLPITMTIPLGPAGGASVTDTTSSFPAGNVGTVGGQCSFGNVLTSFGGGGGGAGAGVPSSNLAVAGAGGGIQSAGAGSTLIFAPNAGGKPRALATIGNGNPATGFGGADAGPTGTAAVTGFESAYGGASGGSTPLNQGVGGIGGDTSWGCAGGGGAASRNTLTGTPLNGSSGGCSNFPINSTRAAGGAGAEGTAAAVASPGAPGATGVYPFGGNGGGAGGDARASTAGGVATGGNGGVGGFPGGGGGGGGGAGKPNTGTAQSGAGGKGGDACIVLTGEY